MRDLGIEVSLPDNLLVSSVHSCLFRLMCACVSGKTFLRKLVLARRFIVEVSIHFCFRIRKETQTSWPKWGYWKTKTLNWWEKIDFIVNRSNNTTTEGCTQCWSFFHWIYDIRKQNLSVFDIWFFLILIDDIFFLEIFSGREPLE